MPRNPRSRPVSRRFFLRGTGATLALPALPSLTNAMLSIRGLAAEDRPAGAPDSPANARRFCCVFFPNGVSLPPEEHPLHRDWHWFPHETGPDYRFTKPLEPLAKLRGEISILSGLSHPAIRKMVGHATGDSFLTGADQSRGYVNSISIDQLYAEAVGEQTRFPSLTLSSDGGTGTPGRAKTLAFTRSGKPIPSLSEPRTIFNRLFGVEERSVEEQRRAIGRERSLLDSVTAETQAIGNRLDAKDRDHLDEYLTSVREIERRLERADRWLDVQKPAMDPDEFALDAKPGGDARDYIRAIYDLMHAAILTDSTRSLTYQITSEDAKGIGDRFPGALGLKGHHNLSHATGTENGYLEWARYDQFLTEQFAYFVDRLRATPDPANGGSLLDHTLVLYGCSTSRTHAAVNYPLILAGAKSMGLKHGQHRHFDESRVRLSDLYVTLLNQLGLPVDRFADSTGKLDEILA